ncbi:hypothetical protein E3N88_29584 [Mikania micrantha]|uniref:Uncharacterized protein n=1 Tax=Mikania micrantha TaxID=192012 RepID=A0A5N6MJ88_9ASTR|nr:hypothetical protein E3N88_29584 [Mikania micrantha]
MDPSRYAKAPWRRAWRYAKRMRGLWIPNFVAIRDELFDRPPRYAKAMQIQIFIKTNPNSFVRSLPQITEHFLCISTKILWNQTSKPLESSLGPSWSILKPLKLKRNPWKPSTSEDSIISLHLDSKSCSSTDLHSKIRIINSRYGSKDPRTPEKCDNLYKMLGILGGKI